MYEMLKRDEPLAYNLIQPYSDMMFAGVAAGNNAGIVWADNLENPVSAIVWSEGLQCFQFVGRIDNLKYSDELKSFIDGPIISFLKDKGLDYFEFSADTEAWYPIIYSSLAEREIKESWQRVYKSRPGIQNDIEYVLPKHYTLYKIDESFISSVRNDKKVSNPEFLIDYIEQFWGSICDYLKLGFGFAAVNADQIVSFSITSFLYNETYSIGVETQEQHRRKGIAGALTKCLLNMLYEKGYKVWWDCMESNIASQKTAEGASLVLDHTYKVCWFNF